MNFFRRNGGCDNCHSGAEFTAASFSSIARLGVVQRRGLNGAVGGVDGFGNPFSIAVQQYGRAQTPVNGLFMTPSLRNVELLGRASGGSI